MWRTALAGVVVVALSAAAPVLAQTGTITGTVTAADGGQALAGAQIRIGTGPAAVTRVDGRYTLTVPAGTYTVRATRLGYGADSVTSVTVSSGGTATANFALKQSAAILGQVVVTVPYAGEQSGREVTGAVASVTSREFNTGRIVSPQQLITGKIAGVQVVDNNEPGGGIAIRVRGGTSTGTQVGATNEPLYVIDGVPLTLGGGVSSGRNPLNFLNAQDIENITVLKDASATAIYGSRGANGVVLVTTRSGSSGPQFSYTGTLSSSRATGGPDMVNAAQYRAAVQQYGSVNVPYIGNANTDWLGKVEQNGGGIEHDLNVNGRRADAAYHLGLDYLDQKGVLRGTDVQRVAGTINYSDRVLNRLTLRTHLKGARSRDYYTPGGVLGEAVALPATQPVFSTGTNYFQWADIRGANNPIADLAQIQDQGTTTRSIGNGEAEYALPWISGLSATLRGSYDAISADRTTFTPSYNEAYNSATEKGNITQNLPKELSTVVDAFGHYTTALNRFSSALDIVAGYSRERFRGDYASYFAQGLSTDLLGLTGVPAAVRTVPSYDVQENRLISGFGRVNLTFKDKYLLTGTVRRDGSSKFGPGHQWGTFPSVAFAWRATDEQWLQGRFGLSDLRLRASWGLNGNQGLGGNYFAYTSYTVGTTTSQAQFGNQYITTIRPSASDPNLHWEKTSSVDFGVDYGFVANRVTGSIDYYDKKTTDLLFRVPTAAGTALSNFITTNIGSMSNKGWEFSVNALAVDGGAKGLSWNANFVASTNTNRLTSIDRPGVPFFLTGGIAGGVGSLIQVLQPGSPVNSFFVYQHKMVNGKPVNSDVNGDGSVNDLDMYVDQNNDGLINSSDRRPFHAPQPKWILGHTSLLSWRKFDASTTLRMYLGNYVYNNVASNLGHYDVLSVVPGAPTNLHASALKYGFVGQQYLSDVYVEKASFLRMDNLTIGYTFDHLASLRNARVFGSVQSVFTSTKYSGVDPTAGVNGIDNNIYPRSRTFLTGLSLGF